MPIIQAFESQALDEFESIDIDAIENLESNIQEADEELKIANEALDDRFRTLQMAVEAYDDFTNKRISFEQFQYSVFAVESAVYGIENADSIVLATEANVIDRLTGAIRDIVHAIHVGFQKYIDYLHYSYSWFSLQRGKTVSLRNKLANCHGNQTTVRIGINKYMRHGEHEEVVKSGAEYCQQFHLVCQAMTPFNAAIADLTEDDLFSGLRLIKEALIGDPEEWFSERFYNVLSNIEKASSGISTSVSKRTSSYTERSSPVMLGLSSVITRVPNKEMYKDGSFDSLFASHRYMYAHVDRKMKIRVSTILDGSVSLDLKKSDILRNLDESSKLIEAALKLSSLAARFSNDGGFIDGAGNILQKREREEKWNADLFQTMSFYRRICSMIYDSVSSAYNFSMGNIKQMNRIAEKAISQM